MKIVNRITAPVVALAIFAVAIFVMGCAIQPKRVAETEMGAQLSSDLNQMFADQEPLEGSLTLHQAMARAVKYSLDQRLGSLEYAIAEGRATGARLDMLPSLVASDGYFGRDNVRGSVSESLATGLQSLEPSTSEERELRRTDLTLAFNLLDFGVTYVRASQQANEALIAEERRSKAIQGIAQSVQGAYWRALGAQRILPDVGRLVEQVATAIDRSEGLERDQLLDPVSALSYQRSLLDKLGELSQLRAQLETAEVELARLMNLPPGARPTLDAPELEDMRIPSLELSLSHLERDALKARPELREEEYQVRISQLEVRRAVLSMLPGLEVEIGHSSDSNKYLTDGNWWDYSAVLARNLVEIVTAPQRIALAKTEVELAESRRLAVAMAVVSQVHVAHRQLTAANDMARLSDLRRQIDLRTHRIKIDRAAIDWESELDEIDAAVSRAVSELHFYLDYAAAKAAYAQLQNAVGFQPAEYSGAEDVETVATRIARSMDYWRRRAGILRDHPDATVAVNLPSTPASAAD